eukprot:TRINITY_DN6450_c0_g1_i5.p2 TRINITY_DN6450_c0_g1~~TRINITY_DN6450_c0_g1_i5.p2  ORF type:complete len:115 (+),score=22.85 TRINITY_DN6450_c0_g1_i5:25-369(+)
MKLLEKKSKSEKAMSEYISHSSSNYLSQLFSYIPVCNSTVNSIKPMFYAKNAREALPTLLVKLGVITMASAGFGALMAMFTSGMIDSHTAFIDHSKSSASQVKQHYFVCVCSYS